MLCKSFAGFGGVLRCAQLFARFARQRHFTQRTQSKRRTHKSFTQRRKGTLIFMMMMIYDDDDFGCLNPNLNHNYQRHLRSRLCELISSLRPLREMPFLLIVAKQYQYKK
ncbi:MAG: hypothetical protein ACJ749_08935 [Flavisolibacter sp.]